MVDKEIITWLVLQTVADGEQIGESIGIARIRTTEGLLLTGTGERISTINLVDRAVVNEKSAGSELRGCGVLFVHQVRIGLDVAVDIVLGKEAALVSRVLALKIPLRREGISPACCPRRRILVIREVSGIGVVRQGL